MPPKKNKEESGDPKTKKTDESDDSNDEGSFHSIPRISFTDLSKSMTAFSGDDDYSVETWIKDFDEISVLMNWNEVEKLIYSKRLLAGTAKLLSRTVTTNSWDDLKKELKEEFGKKLSSAAVHKRLASRKMKPNETYQQYFLHMKEISMLGHIDDNALMEYVIDGIRDTEINKSMLYEAVDMKEFRKKLNLYAEIRKKISTAPQHKPTLQQQKVGSPSTSKGKAYVRTKRCYNCGDTDHESPTCTKGLKCFRCNEFGHKSNTCPMNGKKTLKIQRNENEHHQTPYKEVKINDVTAKVLIDTGSDVNLVNETYFKEVNGEKYDYDPNSVLSLTGIAEYEIQTKGSFTGKIQMDESYFESKFYIVDDNAIPTGIILGNPILNEVELNFKVEGVSAKKVLHLTTTTEYDEVTYDIGDSRYTDKIRQMIEDYDPKNRKKESNVELKIILSDENPIYQSPRRLAPLEKEIVNKQIDEWLDKGIIQPSKSDFASPIVLAKKKDGSFRLCIDFRRLNKKIIKERYPLPLIEDQIDRLKNAKMFTSLDLKNGFLHVNVDKFSRKYTSFVTPLGQYEFLKMPFGLCTASSVFQRFINDVFRDFIIDGTALAYLDDLIIPSATEEEMLIKLQRIFKTAEEYGIEFNWKKCQFFKREIAYLGYVIREGEISPSKDKVIAVSKFSTPNNIKSVQSFLGLTGYFRKFVRNYSLIARPLTDLLKKGTEFNFDEKCMEAFKELKTILCQSPVLGIYNPNLETELHTDASADGFGAVLLQRSPKDNLMHPIYYMSKKTSSAERKYHSYYLEIMAIAEAIKKFRVYLLGIKFKIVTDCSALTMTLQKNDLPPRVARWALLLEEYDYTIEHRPKTRLKHADALSRQPVKKVNVLTETAARLGRAQDEDLKIKLLKKLLEKEPFEDYVLDHNVLWKVKDGAKLMVVPKRMQNEIIRKCHEKGHFGVKKTAELLTREYHFENLNEKVKNVIDNCVECILISHKRGKKEGMLNPIDKGDTPLSTYHIDHLGPLTSTNKNYRYILTVVDGFTKFTWIYPTKTLSTEEVLERLKLQQQTFGSPHRIITDRNASFTSNAFKEYCEVENIVHHAITTGQPRGNGQVERMHQVIINVLSKLSTDDPTKWYKHVSAVQRCINGSYQRSIKMSPFELLTGVKMKDKNDDILELIEEENVQNFTEQRDELRKRAKESIQNIQEENRKYYNRKRREAIQYKVGDLVAIKRTQFVQGYKLYPKYLGPYEITKRKRNDRYDLKRVGQGEGPINTSSSADMMKPWVPVAATDTSSDSSGTDEDQDGRVGLVE